MFFKVMRIIPKNHHESTIKNRKDKCKHKRKKNIGLQILDQTTGLVHYDLRVLKRPKYKPTNIWKWIQDKIRAEEQWDTASFPRLCFPLFLDHNIEHALWPLLFFFFVFGGCRTTLMAASKTCFTFWKKKTCFI